MNTKISRGIGLTLLGLALTMGVGCSKMAANYSLNKAKERRAEAAEHRAEQYAPELLQETDNLINTAVQLVNSENFKDGRLRAGEASDKSKELLQETKSRRATDMRDQANKWIGFADANDAPSENKTLYQEAQEFNAQGRTAFDKKKYDGAIQAFIKVVDNVKFILGPLKERGATKLADLKTKREGLIAEGAEENYLEGVTKIDEQIARIESLLTEERVEYRTANSAAELALQEAAESLTKTKDSKSQKLIAKIEAALNKATTLGAQIYALDHFTAVSQDFEALLRQYYDAKYDTVLAATSGPELLTRATDLITETQRESARAQLENVNKAISSLSEGKTREYLPGRVEDIEKIRDEAKTQFDAAAYIETEASARKALEEQAKTLTAFNELATKEIDASRGALNVSKGVFDRAQEIFGRDPGGEMSPEDLAFQGARKTMQEELGGRLFNIETDLKKTDFQREQQHYASAIETAKEIEKQAADIVNRTYQVVAFDSIQELSNTVTAYERTGGREYAAKDMNETIALLTESRDLYKAGDYRQALQKASATHARVEDTVQELERVAISRIEEARQQLAKAGEARGEEFESGRLVQVKQQVNYANEILEGKDLKKAIETATEAAAAAKQATESSMRQWAEEEMRRTDLLLARALDAGAQGYAPTQLSGAQDLRRNTQSLFDGEDYTQAQVMGARAALAAEQTLYAPVLKAEDEIASAKRFDGWKHEWERLSQAMVSAGYAREFMDQGKYDLARRHAESSFQVANAVVTDSKRASFYDQLNSLNNKIGTASAQGAGYYQVGDLSSIMGEMNDLAAGFNTGNYEEAQEKIELLEAQLAGLVEMTPNVLNELVTRMNTELAALEDRGAKTVAPDLVAETERKIKYAQLDYKNQRYRPSFENARDALRLIRELDLGLDTRDYDLALSQRFTELSRTLERFGPVLNMGTIALMQLIRGADGRARAVSLMSASNPSDLRQEITEQLAQLRLVEPPSTRIDVNAKAIQSFEMAREGAASFEKLLILDQYSPEDAGKIVQSGFRQVQGARALQQETQAALATPAARTRQTGVRRAIEVSQP